MLKLRKLTVYTPDDAAQFARAKKAQTRGRGPRIDPRKYLYDGTRRTFPTGLLATILEKIPGIELVDKPEPLKPEPYKLAVSDFEPRKGQTLAVAELLKHQRAAAILPTGYGKSNGVAMIASSFPKARVLVTVPKIRLLNQNKKSLERMLGEPVGVLGDSQRELGCRVVVATIQSLASRIADTDYEVLSMLEAMDVWICDEGHGAAADSFRTLSAVLTNCHIRYALTATWLREDGCQLIMEAVLGKAVFEYSVAEGIADGSLSEIRVLMRAMPFPGVSKIERLRYDKAYSVLIVDNPLRNLRVLLDVADYVDNGLTPCLLMVTRVEHGRKLAKILGAPFVEGENETEDVDDTILKFMAGEFPVLVASSILDVGVDMPKLTSAVNAAAGDSAIASRQKPGRGLRKHPDKACFWYTDYEDVEPNFFGKQAPKRRFVYKVNFPGRVKSVTVESVARFLEE